MFYYGLEGRSLDTHFQAKELGSNPATPPANELRWFVKDKAGVSALYLIDDAGNVREIADATTVTGTGTANRLAYWTGAQTIDDLAALTQNRLVIGAATGLPTSHTALTATHILFADSNGLPAGDSAITWDNTGKYMNFPIKWGFTGKHPYNWDLRSNTSLTLQIQDSGEAPRLEIYAKDGNGTQGMSFTLFAKGTPSAITNFEQVRLDYDAAGTFFQIVTNAGGSGTIRPLKLITGANSSQVVLNTDGTVNFGSVVDAATGFQVNNTGASGTFLRGDGTNYIASVLVLPNAATANRLVYATSSNTYGESADLTYDGTDLALASGKRFRMQGQNRTRHLNSMARALLTGDQASNTVNVWTTVNFDNTDDFDTDTIHDPASSNSRLTAQLTGKYLVTGSLLLTFSSIVSPALAGIRIIKNGSTAVIYGDLAAAAGFNGSTDTGICNCALISLAANDYVELQGIVTGSSGTWDITDAASLNSFAMEYVGE